jgi:hypothetical protein
MWLFIITTSHPKSNDSIHPAFIKADRIDLNILFLSRLRGNIVTLFPFVSDTDMSGELSDENEEFRIEN